MTIIGQWRRVLFVAAMVSLAFGPFKASGAELPLVRVGYGGIAGYQLPLWVNKEAGLAKKYGIDLEPLLIGGGSLNMQALVGGSIQMSQNSASAAIGAALRKYLKVNDGEVIEATYEFFSRRMVPVPRTEIEGTKSILREMEASQRNPSEFLDMSLVDELEREGFVQRLYGN